MKYFVMKHNTFDDMMAITPLVDTLEEAVSKAKEYLVNQKNQIGTLTEEGKRELLSSLDALYDLNEGYTISYAPYDKFLEETYIVIRLDELNKKFVNIPLGEVYYFICVTDSNGNPTEIVSEIYPNHEDLIEDFCHSSRFNNMPHYLRENLFDELQTNWCATYGCKYQVIQAARI